MSDRSGEHDLHNSSWRSLKRIVGVVPTPIYVLLAVALIVGSFLDASARRKEAMDRARIVRGLTMTIEGCPSSATKISEIISDGGITDHEIEVLHAFVIAEQTKQDGLSTCRTPEWRESGDGSRRWLPSETYAQ